MAPKPKALRGKSPRNGGGFDGVGGGGEILFDYFGKRSYPRECGPKGFYQI